LIACPDFFKPFFRDDKVAKKQLFVDRPDVSQRTGTAAKVAWKRPRDKRKCIDASY